MKLLILTLALSLAACTPPSPNTSTDDADTSIVRGKSVAGRDTVAKSVVALVAELAEGQALCTGTLLSEDTVLTAAHCVEQDPQALVVVFGSRVKSASSEARRDADAFVQNPRWKRPTARGRGDLAIVHFTGGLPPGYVPVTLAPKGTKLTPGTPLTLVGYGVTNGLSRAGAGTLRQTQSSVTGRASPSEFITDGQETSVCFGDSGGPAFLADDGGHWLQIGVASSVTSEACDDASVHTNLVGYLSWLKSASAKISGSPRASRSSRKPVELVTSDDAADDDEAP